jgi:hypothetical protein
MFNELYDEYVQFLAEEICRMRLQITCTSAD